MKLNEFIQDFAENHQVQHIDDIKRGIIVSAICEDIYLVSTKEVSKK